LRKRHRVGNRSAEPFAVAQQVKQEVERQQQRGDRGQRTLDQALPPPRQPPADCLEQQARFEIGICPLDGRSKPGMLSGDFVPAAGREHLPCHLCPAGQFGNQGIGNKQRRADQRQGDQRERNGRAGPGPAQPRPQPLLQRGGDQRQHQCPDQRRNERPDDQRAGNQANQQQRRKQPTGAVFGALLVRTVHGGS
jgi:hypothetical protein